MLVNLWTMCKSFLLGNMLDESANFGCLYWAFVDVPPVTAHAYRKEGGAGPD